MVLIRPLYCVREEDIIAWKRYNDLEFIQCACRFTENCTMCDNGGGGSKRQETKLLLRRLKRDNPNIENSIFRSIHAVALDTMPGYKSEGVEHSFLERFHAMEEWQLTLSCEVMQKHPDRTILVRMFFGSLSNIGNYPVNARPQKSKPPAEPVA